MPSGDNGSFVSTIDSDVEPENLDELVALPASAQVMHITRQAQTQEPRRIRKVKSWLSHAPAASTACNESRAIPKTRSSALPDVSETERAARRRGFESLAEHMVESQGHEAAIFRRFDDVNLKLLMGYEGRIAALRGRLRVAEENLEGNNEGDIESLERQLEKELQQYCELEYLVRMLPILFTSSLRLNCSSLPHRRTSPKHSLRRGT